MIPEWYVISVVAIFGLIIGSFLNVVIYRLHTGKSLNDRSHCLSCGTTLRWYELLPVFSYLALLGRCRSCGSYIPYRYALVELLTAGAFVLAYLKSGDWIEFLLLAVFVSTLVIGLVYDFYHMIIPDEVSYSAAALAAALVGYQSWIVGSWSPLVDSLFASLLIFTTFAGLWYFSRGRAFGFGDAKLAFSLGALVGLSGLFSLVVLSFWVGAIVVLGWLLWRESLHIFLGKNDSRRVSMKSEVPFAPFMIVAFGLVYFFNVDILAIIAGIYGL